MSTWYWSRQRFWGRRQSSRKSNTSSGPIFCEEFRKYILAFDNKYTKYQSVLLRKTISTSSRISKTYYLSEVLQARLEDPCELEECWEHEVWKEVARGNHQTSRVERLYQLHYLEILEGSFLLNLNPSNKLNYVPENIILAMAQVLEKQFLPRPSQARGL